MAKVDVVATRSKMPVGAQGGDQGHGDGDDAGRAPGTRSTSSRSIGTATLRALVTVCLVRNDEPRLPWKMLAIQVPYCASRPLLSPSWCSSTARAAGVSLGPEDGQGGVAGQEMDEEEGEDRDEEADDDQLHEPGCDEPEHGRRGAQSLRHIGRRVEDAAGEAEGLRPVGQGQVVEVLPPHCSPSETTSPATSTGRAGPPRGACPPPGRPGSEPRGRTWCGPVAGPPPAHRPCCGRS